MNNLPNEQAMQSDFPHFPSIEVLHARGVPFSLDQLVPNVPQIYLMYGLHRQAGRVGSAQGKLGRQIWSRPATGPLHGYRKQPAAQSRRG